MPAAWPAVEHARLCDELAGGSSSVTFPLGLNGLGARSSSSARRVERLVRRRSRTQVGKLERAYLEGPAGSYPSAVSVVWNGVLQIKAKGSVNGRKPIRF